MPNPKQILIQALKESGSLLVRRMVRRRSFHYKGRANLITEADMASEKLICKKIQKAFPHHAILSEESGQLSGKLSRQSGYQWVLDPLDGTTNFAHSFPVACVSIALVKVKEKKSQGVSVLLGGVYDPFRKELFLAEKRHGATLNGKTVRVSGVLKLKESLLMTGFPYDRMKRPRFYTRIYARFMQKVHDVRRSGSASLDLCWIACGRVDGFWEFKLHPWDVAAGKLIIEEAGGKVTNFGNKKWQGLRDFGPQTLATNGKIHAQMLKVLDT
ncbi:MAG: inositol monophosphatase [Elusimicrobia bacterium]|nr:inositol monophosphatase [Elusimicrobiota bacterium]